MRRGVDPLHRVCRGAGPRREGFSVEAATIDDIGGYAGRLPTILQGFGTLPDRREWAAF